MTAARILKKTRDYFAPPSAPPTDVGEGLLTSMFPLHDIKLAGPKHSRQSFVDQLHLSRSMSSEWPRQNVLALWGDVMAR